jgi:serine/threonine protein kinase
MLREAQAMARLSDPHVVAVYDVGLHEGTVYLVMEYIDGYTLTEWLRAAPRSSNELLRVFGDAGRGLAVAHQKGLVHRDFKPENVLVAHDGRARVTDFGLARESDSWLHARPPDDSVSTELYAPTRGLVGTPAYMAPELFEGGSASPASDQFAFCVALFTALFDKHPFKAGEGIALSELVTRVRAGTLQRPALNAPSEERLFGVLQRGLAAAPSARLALQRVHDAALGCWGSRRGRWFWEA